MTNLPKAPLSKSLSTYSSRSLSVIAICFVLSGATGLIYEVLWARMLGLVFGGTTLAVSTVLAAFMGGLALGSTIAGRVAGRLAKPLRAYGLIEIGIALYALVVPLILRSVDYGYAIIWQELHPSFFVFSLWRFALSGATLLVPTTLMGATLPVLAAVLLRAPCFKSTSVTRLYTYNLAGAIIGTVAAGFLLLPTFGLHKTIYLAAAINFLIGVVAVLVDARTGAASADAAIEKSVDDGREGSEARTLSQETAAGDLVSEAVEEGTTFWLFCAFISGFVTISTQVAWTRVLTMIIGSSTYAFSIVVALSLVGLSVGAFIVARKERKGGLRRAVFAMELFIALDLLLSVSVMNVAPSLLVFSGLKLQIGSWGGLLLLQIVSVAFLILLPSLLMGMIMPLVLVWVGQGRQGTSVRLVGRSYALNTIGAIAGAFSAGFILIPRFGTRFTIVFAAALCVIVAGISFPALSLVKDRDIGRAIAVGGSLAFILGAFVLTPALDLNQLSIGAYDSLVRVLAKARGGDESESLKATTGGHELLFYQEGPTSNVSVRKDWGITSLAINGRTNASDRDMPTQIMLAQLPLLLAPSTKTGLIVGFASGVSAGAILQSPIESVTCVELEPATVNASRYFEHVNNHPLNDPRLHLVIDDARAYLRVNPARYDLIMSEPSHPWVPGVANLFTEEFFQTGRSRLNDGGVFVQWLQVYQLSNQSLQSVLATFHRVFPHVMVFRVGGNAAGKDLILVGSQSPLTLDRIAERMRDARVSAELARIEMKSEADVRAWFVCDETRLAPAVAGAVINTDDNMHVETTAPREAFLPLKQTNAAWIDGLAVKR
jgi:spermidine synthase